MEDLGIGKGRRMIQTVLVTGATGFLGFWLTQALVERGVRVVALVRDRDFHSPFFSTDLWKKVHIVQGDLEQYAALDRAINEFETDTVFHLAAQTIVGTALRSPLATFESNIRGTYHLLEACRNHRDIVQRIVIASSDKSYGSSPILPYTEEMPLRGAHPYDVSKSCADLISHTYAQTYRMPVVVARCGNLFGGGDFHWSRLIPGTIRALRRGERPVIRSDGSYTRDYLHVDDAVEAYLQLAHYASQEAIRGQAFNFGPNEPYSVLQIVNTLRKLMHRTDLDPIIQNGAVSEIKDQSLDSTKAREWLNWQPRLSLEEGLEKTVRWYDHLFAKAAVAEMLQ